MKLKAEIKLSRAVLESLTDEDLRFIEAEVSRRVMEHLRQIHQVASDGWGTSGEAAALMRIAELTTPILEQRVREIKVPA